MSSSRNAAMAPKATRVASFGCQSCARRWTSARAQPNIFQKCKTCLTECYPLEFTWQMPNKLGNMNRETAVGHDQELCGKCIELGYSCVGDEVDDGDAVVVDLVDILPLETNQALGNRGAFNSLDVPHIALPKKLSQKQLKKMRREQMQLESEKRDAGKKWDEYLRGVVNEE